MLSREFGMPFDYILHTFRLGLLPWLLNLILESVKSRHAAKQCTATLEELDLRIAGVPSYHGLRSFKNGITGLTKLRGADYNALFATFYYAADGLIPDNELLLLHQLITLYLNLFKSKYDLQACNKIRTDYELFVKQTQLTFPEASTDFPKFHFPAHAHLIPPVAGDFRTIGTDLSEAVHGPIIKDAYYQQNHQNTLKQFAAREDRRVCRLLSTPSSAITTLPEVSKPINKKPPVPLREYLQTCDASFQLFLSQQLQRYTEITTYSGVELEMKGRFGTMRRRARALSKFHNKPRFDGVKYTHHNIAQFGKLRLVFGVNGIDVVLLLIESFMEYGRHCTTGDPLLRALGVFHLVPLTALLSVEHFVPRWNERGGLQGADAVVNGFVHLFPSN